MVQASRLLIAAETAAPQLGKRQSYESLAMRVLIVSHVAPPHVGGVENLVAMEVEALLDAGHEVVWVTSDLLGDGHSPPAHERLQLVRVRAWHVLERRFQLAYPLFSPRIATVLWRYAGWADVVHAHGFVFLSSVMALFFSRLRGTPSILTDHGGMLYYPSRMATLGLRVLIETLGRTSARCATRLVAYNADVADLLVRLAGKPVKLRFVANSVDRRLFHAPAPQAQLEARSQLNWDPDRKYVLFVGRLVPDKGVDVLLEAADPSYSLVFCGPAQPEVIQRVKDSGAEYLSPRPQAELIHVYHAADCLALPSWNEGFPVVIQEALVCGLPVVTSDHRGYDPYRELPGLFLTPADPADVRATIKRALEGGSGHASTDSESTAHLLPEAESWLDQLFGGLAE